MNDESYIKPFLKWAGGKRRLLTEIRKRLPEDIKDCMYCEPFIDGGAVLLDLQPKRAIINDCNCELINCFQMIKQSPEKLVKELETYENTPEFFYSIRSLDQQPGLHALTDIQRAARIIYLNRTCFNGLYRVNSQGYFNTPFGQYKHPVIANKPVIMAVSEYLNTANVKIVCGDYSIVLKQLPSDAFVYLDPPYHPITASSSFTSYTPKGWNEEDQLRLRDACRSLDKRGIRFLMSNSSAQFIKETYQDFTVHVVKATRSINSKGSGRSGIDELLICNYTA